MSPGPSDPSLPRARTSRGPARLLAVVLALTAGAVVAVGAASRRDPAAAARSAGFQALLRGLGGGPAVHLARCAHAFDRRLDDGCVFRTSPVPGCDGCCAHGLAGLPDR